MIYYIAKSERLARFVKTLPDNENIILIDSENTIRLNQINENCNAQSYLFYDSETSGLDCHTDLIYCIQIGTLDNQYIIDVRDVNIHLFKDLLESKTLIGINLKFDFKFLFSYGIIPKKVYDLMLVEMVICCGEFDEETDRKSHYSLAALTKKYTDEVLDKTIGKDFSTRSKDSDFSVKELLYAAKDISILPILYKEQLKHQYNKEAYICEKLGQTYSFEPTKILENNFCVALSNIEYNGINIDAVKWKELSRTVSITHKEVVDNLNKATVQYYLNYLKPLQNKNEKIKQSSLIDTYHKDKKGNMTLSLFDVEQYKKTSTLKDYILSYSTTDSSISEQEVKYYCTLNWNSPTVLLQVFNEFGLDMKGVNKREISLLPAKLTDLKSSTKVSSEQHEDLKTIIQLFKEQARLNALITKFLDKLLEYRNPSTGYIYTDYFQLVSTGRLSARNPNLMQVVSGGEEGKLIRACFIPDYESDRFIDSDFSGAEARVAAEYSQDDLWTTVFKSGLDLHGEVASEVFNISLDKVQDKFPLNPNLSYRSTAKTINFGLIFGMGEHKLADMLNISKEQAKKLIDDYFLKTPKLKKFLNNLSNFGMDNGFSLTLDRFKRLRWYYNTEIGYNPDKKEKSAVGRKSCNQPIQACNANFNKLACIKMYNYITTQKFSDGIDLIGHVKMRLLVHDQIISTCTDKYAEEWAGIQERLMIEAAQECIKTIPVVVDTNITEHWKK